MHSDYLNPVIRQLRDQQVRFAPREKKIEQVTQAERLLGELDPARIYPYEYICYPNHEFPARVVSRSEALGPGGQPRPAACSSRTCRMRRACRSTRRAKRVLTVEELAKRFSVSTKTISRWRRQGLISRRFVMDGRKRVGLPAKLRRSVCRAEPRSGCSAARSSAN